jgi:hypothetical protein
MTLTPFLLLGNGRFGSVGFGKVKHGARATRIDSLGDDILSSGQKITAQKKGRPLPKADLDISCIKDKLTVSRQTEILIMDQKIHSIGQ